MDQIPDSSVGVASTSGGALHSLMIQKCRDLGPVILKCREEIDSSRQLPPELVQELRNSGLFRLFVPSEFGGYEIDPSTFVKIIEEISAWDGSVGWVVSVAAVGGLLAGHLPNRVAKEIYGEHPDAIFVGGINPTGQAGAVEGGYLVSGHWAFVSGITHADWVYGNSVVYDGDRPRLNSQGLPEVRLMVFPGNACRVHDTWHVGGLRGTGSHDISVQELFVPADHSLTAFSANASQPGVLYKFPFSLFAVLIAAVPLGIANRAITALVELAKSKRPVGSAGALREKPSAQVAVARASGLYRSGRSFLLEQLARVENEIAERGEAAIESRALLRIACTQAATSSREAVDLMFEAGGGTSIYTAHPLERCFRDVHAAMQHIAVSPASLELAGRVLFGLDQGTARF